MKKITCFFLSFLLIISLAGCQAKPRTSANIAVTTAPLYEFTSRICSGTTLSVECIITEEVSCLHNYTLKPSQLQTINSADLVIISGAGLESFMSEALRNSSKIVDASKDIPLLHQEDGHRHEHNHSHSEDPHIWLDPTRAQQMVNNIYNYLVKTYPHFKSDFQSNCKSLLDDLEVLKNYGESELHNLSCKQLVTFHNGFAYLADAFDLEILHAIEEEEGQEASASEIIHICNIIQSNEVPAIFTENNGSTSAAKIISKETNTKSYSLNMGMSDTGYFDAMYHNINTLKEALG